MGFERVSASSTRLVASASDHASRNAWVSRGRRTSRGTRSLALIGLVRSREPTTKRCPASGGSRRIASARRSRLRPTGLPWFSAGKPRCPPNQAIVTSIEGDAMAVERATGPAGESERAGTFGNLFLEQGMRERIPGDAESRDFDPRSDLARPIGDVGGRRAPLVVVEQDTAFTPRSRRGRRVRRRLTWPPFRTGRGRRVAAPARRAHVSRSRAHTRRGSARPAAHCRARGRHDLAGRVLRRSSRA